jgi:hypothetical protein
MEHGRGHDERHRKTHHPRYNNTPRDEDTEIESALVVTDRHRLFPPRAPRRMPGPKRST